MAMVNVVTIGSGWWAWFKGQLWSGAACYIRQMNRVNSRSGSATMTAP